MFFSLTDLTEVGVSQGAENPLQIREPEGQTTFQKGNIPLGSHDWGGGSVMSQCFDGSCHNVPQAPGDTERIFFPHT